MLTVYTDGACLLKGKNKVGHTGHGGWAWWVNDSFYDQGYVADTTNNVMEMLAVQQALAACAVHRPKKDLLIVSDSAYVVNCFKERWHERWEENGWVNSSRKPVANREHWVSLIHAVAFHPTKVVFQHMRGHGRGGPEDAPHLHGNERADALAVQARKIPDKGFPTSPPWAS